MRRRNLTIWVIAVLCFGIQPVDGTIYFDDGGVHDISSATGESVTVLNSFPDDDPTTINLLAGGRVGSLGDGLSDLEIFDTSIANMFDNSDVERNLVTHHASQVSIYGGSVHHDLITLDSSIVTIHGGSAGPDLHIEDSSMVTIYGGWISSGGGSVLLRHNSTTTIVGDDFMLDGSPLSYGTYTALDFASGNLTGSLINGQPLNSNFYLYDNAVLTLTPEPSTLLLLGLGAVMVRRKRC